MRNLIVLLLTSLLASCLSGREGVQAFAPELLSQWDQSVARENELKSQLPALERSAQDAVASENLDDDAPAAEALASANTELAAVEAVLAPIEERVNREQAQPVADGLGLLHPALGALVMSAVPLLGRRGRKLYWSALRNASRGQLLTSAGDVLKALGAHHSEPEPQPISLSMSSPGGASTSFTGLAGSSAEPEPPAPAPAP